MLWRISHGSIYIFWPFQFFFQELEQEKYHLRRRLQAAEEEYELRVNELQADINSLRKSLEEATTAQRQSEKEKSLLITNLTEQNQRLTSQLKEVRFFSEDVSIVWWKNTIGWFEFFCYCKFWIMGIPGILCFVNWKTSFKDQEFYVVFFQRFSWLEFCFISIWFSKIIFPSLFCCCGLIFFLPFSHLIFLMFGFKKTRNSFF